MKGGDGGMSLRDEIDRLADQYGGIGKANQYDEKKVRAILEPVVAGRSRTRLRAWRDGLWARSRATDDRYADLAGEIGKMVTRRRR